MSKKPTKKQPDWCNYSNANEQCWGCWSLLFGYIKDKDYCKVCEYYREQNTK